MQERPPLVLPDVSDEWPLFHWSPDQTDIVSDAALPDLYRQDGDDWEYTDIAPGDSFLAQHFGCDAEGKPIEAPSSSEGLSRSALFLQVRHELRQGTLVAKIGQHRTNRRALPRVIFEAPRLEPMPRDSSQAVAPPVELEEARNLVDYTRPFEALARLAVTHGAQTKVQSHRRYIPQHSGRYYI